MNSIYVKQRIKELLGAFSQEDPISNALNLFGAIGYKSEKRLDQPSYTPSEFLVTFNQEDELKSDKALINNWKSIHFLFQLTADEIKAGAQLSLDFGSQKKVDDTIIESYIFFVLELTESYYNRTDLANITREINKIFRML
ncbi:hypothetical protein ACFLVW_02360 [Chloroflexota bacterium]